MSSTATLSGSDQSKNRSLGGILVHLLALFTSFVGPVIMYAVSDNEFTRENARNAINWHITVIMVTIIAFIVGFFGADEATIGGEPVEIVSLPGSIDTVLSVVSALLLITAAIAIFAILPYAIIGTSKAASGTAWSYPGAVDITDRFR